MRGGGAECEARGGFVRSWLEAFAAIAYTHGSVDMRFAWTGSVGALLALPALCADEGPSLRLDSGLRGAKQLAALLRLLAQLPRHGRPVLLSLGPSPRPPRLDAIIGHDSPDTATVLNSSTAAWVLWISEPSWFDSLVLWAALAINLTGTVYFGYWLVYMHQVCVPPHRPAGVRSKHVRLSRVSRAATDATQQHALCAPCSSSAATAAAAAASTA